MLVPALVLAIAVALALAVSLLAARRHAMHTGAPRARVWSVCAAVAATSCLPVVTVLVRDGGGLDLGSGAALLLFFGLALLTCVKFLRPPLGLAGTKEALPAVEDEAFLARIAELSARFGLRPPIVRLLRSNQGNLSALAFAGGLVEPTLIVTDGIVHRLDPDERDAIVAHELAHVSTGSIWVLMFAGGVSWAVAAPLAYGLPFLVGLLVAANVQALLYRLVQRRYEIVCDREAAKVVGYDAVAGGLGKIHRVHVVPERGLLPLLFHATATHPHHAVRAAALAEREAWAGRGDEARLRTLQTAARPHRVATVVAFAVWIGVALLALRYGDRPGLESVFVVVLLLLVAKFALLLFAMMLKRWRRQRRRVGFRTRSARWMKLGMIGGVLGYAILLLPVGWRTAGLVLILPSSGLIIAAAAVGLRPNRLRQRVGAALQRHAWGEAISTGEAAPELLARDPALQHDLALCRALAGERAAARDELSRIGAAWPNVAVARLSLAILAMNDDPVQALEHADALAGRLPDDPAGPVLRGRALVRLGRLDEAEEAARAALELEPDDATAHTILSAVQLARGDAAAAAEECRRAVEKEPGAAEVRVARARLALATEGREQARRLVTEAIEAAEAAPFSFLAEEARELEVELEARVDGGG